MYVNRFFFICKSFLRFILSHLNLTFLVIRYLRSMYRIGLLLLLHFEVSSRTCSTSVSTPDNYQTDWFHIVDSGAPGYITSTLLNGMSFVNGWEQNFFVSKWSMHQLVMINQQ